MVLDFVIIGFTPGEAGRGEDSCSGSGLNSSTLHLRSRKALANRQESPEAMGKAMFIRGAKSGHRGMCGGPPTFRNLFGEFVGRRFFRNLYGKFGGEDVDSPAPPGRGESDSSSSASESPPVKAPGAKKQRVKAPTRGSYTRGSLKTSSEIQ